MVKVVFQEVIFRQVCDVGGLDVGQVRGSENADVHLPEMRAKERRYGKMDELLSRLHLLLCTLDQCNRFRLVLDAKGKAKVTNQISAFASYPRAHYSLLDLGA